MLPIDVHSLSVVQYVTPIMVLLCSWVLYNYDFALVAVLQ